MLWLHGLIGGARGLELNNITTTYDSANNRCIIKEETYKCSNHKYASIHKCRGSYNKTGASNTYYKQYAKDQKVDNTRYYN